MILPKSMHSRVHAWFILIILTVIWGSSFILMKKGLVAFSSGEVAALRIFTASLFMLPFAISWMKQVPRSEYKIVFLSGLIGSLIPAFLFAVAQTKLDSAITGIINSLTPVFVILVGAALFSQKISLKMILGLLLALLGTLALMRSGSDSDLSVNFYAGFIILATILYGFNVNILKFRLSEINPIAVSSISIVLCAPIALIHLLFFTDFLNQLFYVEGTVLAFGYISLLGVFGTGLALILFNFLIRLATPLFASSVTYLIPIVAVFWGIVDGETLSILQFGSMAVIIGGVYLANKK
ncbi:MAG: DMT family transporter [Cyclobacteriaceae bacterium]|nr:DMT family transporter [Cyclobacteriaceae bacterium]